MLVSLAVLAMAISVVGVVFRITTQTASQAAAYSETLNWVRQFTNQVQEDLRSCDPSKSILVLVGRTQRAARTEDDRVAGKYYRVLVGNPSKVPVNYDPELDSNLADPQVTQYSDPRADIMMFFSNRPSVSQAPDPNADPNAVSGAAAAGVKLAPIQVVYGHAALGEGDPNGTAYLTTLHHIDNAAGLSSIPLLRWQLARRAVILDQNSPPGKVTFSNRWFGYNCGDEWYRITHYQANSGLAGDVAALNLPEMLRGFGSWGATPGPATFLPYQFDTGANWGGSSPPSASFPLWNGLSTGVCILDLLYNGGLNGQPTHHVATILEQVPVGLRSNLGLHLLPACAWFQVEFLMPEDPRNSLEYTDPNDALALSKRTDMPRWTAIDPGSTYVFVPDTEQNRDLVAKQIDTTVAGMPFGRLATFARLDQDSAGDTNKPGTALTNRVIRMWPYAIRITVRVYDPRGRLDQPIVRSIVHRFD
jgi:hypothetical protein